MLRMIDLTTLLTWLVMIGNAGVIVLFAVSIASLPIHQQRRAKLGLFAMVLVLAVVSASLFFLASRVQTATLHLSQYLLPLAMCILLASMYRLSFPPLLSSPVPQSLQPRRLLLLWLTIGAGIGICGLLVIDLFFA